MKITNGHQQYLNAVRTNQKAVVKKTLEKAEKPQQSHTVSVEISEEAKKLSEQMQQAAPSERAAQIKRAIQNGTYSVSPEKIAGKMVEAMNAQKEEQES